MRHEFLSSIEHLPGRQMLFHFVRNGESGGNSTEQMSTACQVQLEGISHHYFNFIFLKYFSYLFGCAGSQLWHVNS